MTCNYFFTDDRSFPTTVVAVTLTIVLIVAVVVVIAVIFVCRKRRLKR